MEDINFLWNETKRKLKEFIEYNKIPLNQIVLSFSGGKDSTVLYQLCKEINIIDKINVVFFNTKMEYQTINDFINSFNNIQIVDPKSALPLIYLKYGLPIHSKYTSEMIYRLQRHNFNFVDDTYKSYDELYKKYPKCKIALKWLCNENIKLNCPEWLKRQLKDITFKVSNKCCEVLKKRPMHKYIKDKNIKLSLVGIRKTEGGIRSSIYKSCVLYGKDVIKYFPLFLINDDQIKEIIKLKNIKISDAYTVYKMDRTGCVACPFSKEWKKELEVLKKYETNKYNFAIKTYSKIYDIYNKKSKNGEKE